MLIFQLEDLEGARQRGADLGIRVVWQIDLPDISGTHLHPSDTRGAIVSIDGSRPYGSWRWGGPDWTARVGRGAPGRLRGVTLAVEDPRAVAARWGDVLGTQVGAGGSQDGEQAELALEDATVRFAAAESEAAEGLSEIVLELPSEVRRGRDVLEVGAARLLLLDAA